MSKLNTKILKTFIIDQLNSNPEFKNAPVKHHRPQDINPKMLANWEKESNWVRECKRKINEGYGESIDNYSEDSIDVVGAFIHPDLLNENCILRIFNSKEFIDTYRIEILTDEKDEEIIFWNLIVD